MSVHVRAENLTSWWNDRCPHRPVAAEWVEEAVRWHHTYQHAKRKNAAAAKHAYFRFRTFALRLPDELLAELAR